MSLLKNWLSAFTGFYKPNSEISKLDPVSKWLFSARSVILIISFQAGVIASILSYMAHSFNLAYSILLVLGLVCAHAASNLMNDYFGFKNGHDTQESPRRNYTLHPIASGTMTARGVKLSVAALVTLGVVIAAFFTYLHGITVMYFAAAGLLLMLLYDASPITLKSVGLGEIASFFVWGPLMIGGGFYALTGTISTNAFLISIPYGLGVMSILVGKHIDQMQFDKSKEQTTLPILLGTTNARLFNAAAIAAMYVLVPIYVYYGVLPVFALLIALNLPKGAAAIEVFSKPKPTEPPAGYVGWPLWYHRYSLVNNRNFGWYYILGLCLGILLLA